MWRDRAMDRAFAEMDRAIDLNPGSFTYRSLRAFCMSYAGQSEAALAELDRAMQVNPHYPVAYHIFCGRALFNLKRYAEAMPHLDRVRAEQPKHPNALALAAACYAANNDQMSARDTIAEIAAFNPRFTLSWARKVLPYTQDTDREHFLEMLEKAGLPA
jgi:adenylate cyclase